MKTVHKLILKSYLGPMVMSFFIVMFVLLMNFMWRYIDELVGKGLSIDVILELMFYASGTLIPMALPLSTLFAALMTMGNMGEYNELQALKSAGMSLPRILSPIIVLVFFVSIASFFVANNFVPYSQKKMYSIIYDIRRQKQTIDFKDGIFFNGIDNMSIRVDRQDSKTGKLYNVLIYDNRKVNGDMTTIVAEEGFIKLSDDKRFLLVTLFDGKADETTRNVQSWSKDNNLQQRIFDKQELVIELEGFNMERTDDSAMASNNKTKNISQLEHDIDSLQNVVNTSISSMTDRLYSEYLFVNYKDYLNDTLAGSNRTQMDVYDSIKTLSDEDLSNITGRAIDIARQAKVYDINEATTKQNLDQLYRHKVEWHRMLSLPISIMIFFLIGAPLGAIIRKGGLGMPVVISVVFFVIYYIISITGEKMAREGTWESFRGMWLSTFILTPIAAFLVYKATNDSNLFNADWYITKIKKIKSFFKGKFSKSNG